MGEGGGYGAESHSTNLPVFKLQRLKCLRRRHTSGWEGVARRWMTECELATWGLRRGKGW